MAAKRQRAVSSELVESKKIKTPLNFYLTESQREKFKALGGGNINRGLRRMVAIAEELPDGQFREILLRVVFYT